MPATLIFVAVLLLVGVLIRQRIGLLRACYIPASVLAGLTGLLVIQALSRAPGSFSGVQEAGQWAEAASSELSGWPGWLIAIVFASLLLEHRESKGGSTARRTLSQVIMVWVIVLGQTTVGLLLTWLIVQSTVDVPNSFGMLIETGFAGGHGTAAAMGEVYAHPQIGLELGLDLGLLVATVGLIYGVVSGIAWVNLGARLGWCQRDSDAVEPSDTTESDGTLSGDNVVQGHGRAIGFTRLSPDAMDPILLQVIWLTLAFGIGWCLHQGVGVASSRLDEWKQSETTPIASPSNRIDMNGESANVVGSEASARAQLSSRLTWSATIGGFPLFIYTLFGGWCVRKSMIACGQGHLIDTALIKHLSAVAMDILVVAAMASLRIEAVVTLLGPLFVLLLGGAIWTAICLTVISRWILPKQHWFELGLINYGMSTGTTATGFVLLRVIDPQLDTDAAEDYALAAPFSAPFIGGGILTVALPLLVLERIPIAASALGGCVVVAALIAFGISCRTK